MTKMIGERSSATAAAARLLPVPPAPVHAALRDLGVRDHHRHALVGQSLRHVTFRDVLLESRREFLERFRRFAKECGLSHAAGITRVEDDSRALVIAAVQLAAHDHLTALAVLVRFARLEGIAVDHRDRGLEAGFAPLEFAQVGRRRTRRR